MARTPARAAMRRNVLVFAGFLVLAALLWWPLPLHITSHVPGVPQWAYDEATFVWNIWHFKDAAIDGLRSPLTTDLVYYPLGVDLILYTYNFYHVLASLPLALATNLPFASNVSLLLSTALSGFGTWLLARWVLRRQGVTPSTAEWAALVGGCVYAFASNRSIYAALGHYDMVTTQWIPFYALMLLRALDTGLSARRRRQAALLAGIFLALTGLAEMISALFLVIFTLIVWLGLPANESERHVSLWRRLAGRIPMPALAGAVAFVLWSPALLPILWQFLTNDFALKGWGEAIPLSTDLLGWLTPTVLHPWFGGDLATELRRVQLRALEGGVRGFRDLNTVFLGWVTPALALLGVAGRARATRIWWWTAIVFGLFTLGPFLQINGEYRFDLDGVEATVPLPYALLHYIPIVKANRAPNRNSVLLMLALAVLAAWGVAALIQWARRRGHSGNAWKAIPIAAALLVVGEHLALPLPLTDVRVPAVYQTIAADPRPVSVLQIPLGWRNSFGVFGPESTLLQYYQTAHGKPMLGGNTSRAPDFKMEYFKRLPYFQALTEIEFGREVSPELRAAAEAQAGELMALYNVGYVLLYPPVENRPPYSENWRAAWDFARATLPLEPEPFWAQDGIEAYRLIQTELGNAFALDLGEESTLAYRAEGWDAADSGEVAGSSALWTTSTESRFFLPLRATADATTYRLRLRAMPYSWPGAPAQSVQLRVNGTALGEALPLGEGWQEVEWTIPAGLLLDSLNRFALEWARADAPRTVAGGARTIGATGVELPVDADLKAFGEGAFMALFDEEGAQNDASAGRRGVNVTTLDPRTGEVLTAAGYDTAANEFESEALAAALAAIPAGRIMLVASSGDATAFLTEDAIAGLRALGADLSMQALRGNHFAVVGVQGAAPGTAAQAMDPGEAFLRVSLDRDRRPLAAAVDWIDLAPVE